MSQQHQRLGPGMTGLRRLKAAGMTGKSIDFEQTLKKPDGPLFGDLFGD
jgi:hypothetical protein